jgi:hypothetical protein
MTEEQANSDLVLLDSNEAPQEFDPIVALTGAATQKREQPTDSNIPRDVLQMVFDKIQDELATRGGSTDQPIHLTMSIKEAALIEGAL